jgi:hypothetical protein
VAGRSPAATAHYSRREVSRALPKLLTPRKPRLGHHGRMRILVVEDEPLLADAVAEWLRGDAHAVDVAYDADACHAKAEQLGDECGL